MLRVYDDNKKLIPEIKPFDLENLIKWNIVAEGMIPKIENCVDAVENGVRGVVILDGPKTLIQYFMKFSLILDRVL